LFIDVKKQANDFFFVTDIGTHGNGLGTEGANLCQHLMGGGIIGQVVNANPITLPGSQQGSGSAYTAAAAGDHDDFIHKYVFPLHRSKSGCQNNREGAVLSGRRLVVWLDGPGTVDIRHKLFRRQGLAQ